MKISSCLVALSLCFSALAARADREEHAASANKTKSTGHNSVKAACAQMQELTQLTKLAANQSLLEELVTKKKLNASEASALETKAAGASSQLSTLTSNATLVSQCAVVDAHESVVVQCDTMTRLEQWQKLASNTTALDELAAKRNLTQAAIAKLQAQAANASTVLKTMESNATLVTACQQLQAKKSNNTGSGSGSGSATASGGSSSSTSQTTSDGIRFASIGNTLWSSIGLLALAVYVFV